MSAATGSIEDCEVPECLARQDRYRDLGEANASILAQYEELEMQIKVTINKFQLMEKTNTALEGSNDKLQEQLDDLRGHAKIIEVESQQWKHQNTILKDKVHMLEGEISKLRTQAEERRRAARHAEEASSVQVVFAPRGRRKPNAPESMDVSALEAFDRSEIGGGDDSDNSSTEGGGVGRGGGSRPGSSHSTLRRVGSMRGARLSRV